MMVGVRAIHSIGSIGEQSGGPARSVTSLCNSVAQSGTLVDIVSGYDPIYDISLIHPDPSKVNLHLIRARNFSRIRHYPGFRSEIEKLVSSSWAKNEKVLVHDHGIWSLTNIATAIAAHRMGVPYVLSPRGMLEPWALKYKHLKKQIALALYQNRIIRASAVMVATADQERDSIKQHFPDLPVAVIANGVYWPPEITARLPNHSTKRRNLLFMSRIHPKKNLFGLLYAWKMVCNEPSRSDWILQIAGPDELNHTQEVKALVSNLGLNARVEFLGNVSEGKKPKLFATTDLFVLPSFSENFGMVVAEALSFGIPVIATRGTPWRVLVDQRCGWWVDTEPAALAVALAEALDMNFCQRKAMGLRGREYARCALSWDRVGAETRQLYDWLLGHATPMPSFIYS